MAASIIAGFSGSFPTPPASNARAGHRRPRRITPRAGHALEILGHAIEYLTDEFVESGDAMSPRNSRLEAVQLLMGFNRQVYFECPVVATMRERLRFMLDRR